MSQLAVDVRTVGGDHITGIEFILDSVLILTVTKDDGTQLKRAYFRVRAPD